MAAVTICSDFGAQENKVSHCFHCSPICLPWSGGTGCHDLSFSKCWVLSQLFHFLLSLSSRGSLVPLHFISLEWYHLHIWGCCYFSPVCASSSPAFHMMYSAQKLNNQGDNIQPWLTSFLILNQSIVLCLILTVASWPAYRFLRRQVRWSGIPISWRIFRSLLWSTQLKALV